MNIFYVAHDNGTSYSESKTWYNNLYLSFVNLGHTVIRYTANLDEEYKRKDFDKLELSNSIYNHIAETAKTIKIDFCFFYVHENQIDINVIKRIRENLNIKIVNYSCNNVHQFYLVEKIAPFFDLNIFSESQVKFKFDRIGAKSYHMPMAANPDVYKSYNLEKVYDVTFIGQRYSTRASYLCNLIKKGIRVDIWGCGWCDNENLGGNFINANWSKFSKLKYIKNPIFFLKKLYHKLYLEDTQTKCLAINIHGPISDDNLIEMYSKSKINLSFSTVENKQTGKEEAHVRLRDFEVPMCGGFYLVEYCKEIEEYYTIGKDIEVFRNKQELYDKITFYLKNPDKREEIAQCGKNTCLQNHTWEKRLSLLCEQISYI